jgi:ATP-binding cassette subfamily G (WHITE) protein 2
VGTISGRLLVNDQPMSRAFIRKTAYVPQADNFVPTMTAQETLAFFADMVLPAAMSAAQKAARVQEVLAALGLSHTAHTLVGGQLPGGLLLRGLSGGERKRLSIAAGIIATPSVVRRRPARPPSLLDPLSAACVRACQMWTGSRSAPRLPSCAPSPLLLPCRPAASIPLPPPHAPPPPPYLCRSSWTSPPAAWTALRR